MPSLNATPPLNLRNHNQNTLSIYVTTTKTPSQSASLTSSQPPLTHLTHLTNLHTSLINPHTTVTANGLLCAWLPPKRDNGLQVFLYELEIIDVNELQNQEHLATRPPLLSSEKELQKASSSGRESGGRPAVLVNIYPPPRPNTPSHNPSSTHHFMHLITRFLCIRTCIFSYTLSPLLSLTLSNALSHTPSHTLTRPPHTSHTLILVEYPVEATAMGEDVPLSQYEGNAADDVNVEKHDSKHNGEDRRRGTSLPFCPVLPLSFLPSSCSSSLSSPRLTPLTLPFSCPSSSLVSPLSSIPPLSSPPFPSPPPPIPSSSSLLFTHPPFLSLPSSLA